MNYITEAEKKMVAENYVKVIDGLNKKYFELYPAMDALRVLYDKIRELRPELGRYLAYSFEPDGTLKQHDYRVVVTDGFGYILFDDEKTTLYIAHNNFYYNQDKREREKSFVTTGAEFDKMMRGENFDSEKIIVNYEIVKNLSAKLTLAARRLDSVANAMIEIINAAEKAQCRDQRKVVDYFKEVSESAPVVKLIKITVEEVDWR